MQVGVLLAEARQSDGAAAQLDLMLRQVEWGQAAGMTHFMLTQHWMYGGITCLQPMPLAGRLGAELDDDSRVGTTVMVAPAYHPVALAEEAATADLVTGGKFILGLGNGYRPQELAMFGVALEERGRRMNEILTLLPRLWNEERVSFEGEFFRLDDVEPHIPNATPGGPTVWVGAKSAVGVRRAARLSDGWVGPSKIPFDELPPLIEAFREARVKAGREGGTVALLRQIVPGGSVDDALERHYAASALRLDAYEARDLDLKPGNLANETRDASRTALLGTVDEIVDRARWLATECGVETLITRVAWLGLSPDEIRDEYARLADAVAAIREIEVVPA